MAYTTHTHTANNVQGNPLLRGLAAAFEWLVSLSERHPSMQRVAQLQAKSDEELAQMGLTREQIPAAAFREDGYL